MSFVAYNKNIISKFIMLYNNKFSISFLKQFFQSIKTQYSIFTSLNQDVLKRRYLHNDINNTYFNNNSKFFLL